MPFLPAASVDKFYTLLVVAAADMCVWTLVGGEAGKKRERETTRNDHKYRMNRQSEILVVVRTAHAHHSS